MATFYQMTPDAFNSGFNGLTSPIKDPYGPQEGRFDSVRRPVRGIQIKEDTYATLQVRTADGRNIPLIDSGGTPSSTNSSQSFSKQYSNFLIQSIQQQRAEKKQIVETFGEPYIFFFGQHPIMIQVSGALLNTEDFNWRAEFLKNYDLYLRGTACVQNKTRVYLSWDTIVTEGYILECATQENAAERHWLNFSFQLFLTNYADVSPIGLSDFPRPSEFQLDPTSFDTTGFGIGFGVSRDLAQQRLLNAAVFGANSLIDTMQDLVTNADGFLSGVTQDAQSLFSGRQLMVPAGLDALPDLLDTQVAVNSIGLVSPLDGRVITLPPRNDRFASAIYGPIQKNLDEYIARLPAWGVDSAPIVSDLFGEQTAGKNNIAALIQAAVASFGIRAQAPAGLVSAGRNGSFTTVPSYTPDSTITRTGGSL